METSVAVDRTSRQKRRARQRVKRAKAVTSLRRELNQAQLQLKKSEGKQHYYKRLLIINVARMYFVFCII